MSKEGQWSKEIALRFLITLFRLDPKCRPLFAMIVAQELETVESTDSLSRLLKRVLTRESGRRRQLISSDDYLKRVENLLLLATIVGTLLPDSNGFAFLNTCDVSDLLPDVNFIDENLYKDIAGSALGGSYIPGLQPRISWRTLCPRPFICRRHLQLPSTSIACSCMDATACRCSRVYSSFGL